MSHATITKIPGIPTFRRIKPNLLGRDFLVADVHGCFTLLQRLLDSVGFDETRDRLFIVGDLVDRGPESHKALEWISKPWVYCVRGNHDQMLIDAFDGHYDEEHYIKSGGKWYLDMLKNDPEQAEEFSQVFNGLPFALELERADGRKIGIIHAECVTHKWSRLVDILESDSDPKMFHSAAYASIWCRDRYDHRDTVPVEDIDQIFVGHYSVFSPLTLGNTIYCDTGAVFNDGKMTVFDIDTQEQWSLSRKELRSIMLAEQAKAATDAYSPTR